MTDTNLTSLVKAAVSSLYHLSSMGRMRSRYNYRRILAELEQIQEPLHSLSELRNIKCVGEKTINKIRELIDREMCKEVDEGRDRNVSVSLYEDGTGSSKKTRKVSREYIPGYRTGGYAIMKALWVKEGMSKHGIAHLGKPYCDSEFDFASKHSAWSSMRTLVRKNLVYREGRSKFYLTEEGRRAADVMFANTSFVESGGGEVVLVIDSREMKSRRRRMFFQDYFEARKIPHETRVLEVGDFLWVRRERICGFIAERKCGSDFVSSISDGRFKEQKARLRSCGMEKVFYFVEGLRARHMERTSRGLVMSCLTATKLEGFTVIETRDIAETGAVIETIDKEVRRRCEGKEGCMEEGNQAVDGMDGENTNGSLLEMTYGSFIERGAKRGNEDPTFVFYLSLLSIRGIGHKKADVVARHYRSIDGFINEVKDARSMIELYSFEVDGKKIPRRNIDDIVEFFLK